MVGNRKLLPVQVGPQGLDQDSEVHVGRASSFVQAEDVVQGDFPGHRAGEQILQMDRLADLVDVGQEGDQGGIQGALETK